MSKFVKKIVRNNLSNKNTNLEKHVNSLEEHIKNLTSHCENLQQRVNMNGVAMSNMLYQLGGICEITDADAEEITGDILVDYDKDKQVATFTLGGFGPDSCDVKQEDTIKDVKQILAPSLNV